MMSDNTKATERKCSVTVAVGKVFCLLTLNFCLVLSHLRRLPDGAQVIESKRRNVFGHFKFLKKGEIVEMYENFLLNDRSSAAIAGAKRRTVVAFVVLLMLFSAEFRFLTVVIKRSVNAWNCSKRNDVNG